MKENFNPWIDQPSLSKALLFLSFQIVQKKHEGVTRHAFFLFLPTKTPCHPSKASLTKEDSTHDSPKRENKRCHNNLVLSQWRRMWSTDSSSLRHRKHLFTKDHPLLWMWSKVKTFLQVASHIKKTTLDKPTISKPHLLGKHSAFLASTPCSRSW